MTRPTVALQHLAYLSDRSSLECICGVPGGLTIGRSERNGLKFRYKVCFRCGHVRTSNPLSPSAAERFYSTSDYRSMYFPNDSVEELIVRQTPKSNSRSRLLEYAEQAGVSRGSVLEWGCGGGWNLVPFRDAGWRTIGFDHDKPFVRMGRELLNLDLNVIDSAAPTHVKNFSADLIILYHVLEHVRDPVGLLSMLRASCRADTLLVVGIPLIEKIPSWKWNRFFHVAHIHYFSTSSFLRVAAMSGWVLEKYSPNASVFALRPSDAVTHPKYRRLDVIKSQYFLLRGFLNPRYRLRVLIRQVLSTLGLLNAARTVKRLI